MTKITKIINNFFRPSHCDIVFHLEISCNKFYPRVFTVRAGESGVVSEYLIKIFSDDCEFQWQGIIQGEICQCFYGDCKFN